jgi:tRNA A58 N-methylase Trm61
MTRGIAENVSRKETLSMDIPRIFTITESAHRIHNPFTPEKLATLGAALRLEPGARVLDLGSGSREMLCTWARDYGIIGLGVDMSLLFTEQARRRAEELGVAHKVRLIHGDAAGLKPTLMTRWREKYAPC